VADQGSVVVAGDGTYRTPATILARAGCYTYAQRIAATPLSVEAISPPGLVPETALAIRRTPVVTTVVSDQRALVGDRLHDTVLLRGLGAHDQVTVRWWLHGPIAPGRGTSCDGLRWDGAPIADRGDFVADRNGTSRTRGTEIEVAGCYTYSEAVLATPSTERAEIAPGHPLETSLATRPVTPYVPEIPSGPAAAGPLADTSAPAWVSTRSDGELVPQRRAKPRHLTTRYASPERSPLARRRSSGSLTIERIGLHAPVDPVGLDSGTMALPNDRRHFGWLSTTAVAGDLLGSSLISGHVSNPRDAPGGLWRLKDARVGDLVRWRTPDGATYRYVVRSVQRFARSRGVPARLLRTDGPHLLHLITCITRRSTSSGVTYADNLVVTAEAVT